SSGAARPSPASTSRTPAPWPGKSSRHRGSAAGGIGSAAMGIRIAVVLALVAAGCSHSDSSGPASGGPAPGAGGASPAASASAAPTTRRPPVLSDGGGPAVGSVSLEPAQPTVASTLKAKAEVSGSAVVSWTWVVDGRPIPGAITDTLPPGSFKKGDTVEALALATDGAGRQSAPAKGQVKIGNSTPVVVSSQQSGGNTFKVTA